MKGFRGGVHSDGYKDGLLIRETDITACQLGLKGTPIDLLRQL